MTDKDRTQSQLWIIAGPNGAGKTTITRHHLQDKISIVNPDEIAADLAKKAGKSAESLAIEAGRAAVRQRRLLIAENRSFAVETTFSGGSATALAKEAKANGYKINLVYVGIDDVRNSVARVSTRIAAGGHDVPYDDLIRRYRRSLDNLRDGFSLADRVRLIDNSDEKRRLVMALDNDEVKFLSDRLPLWVPAILPDSVYERIKELHPEKAAHYAAIRKGIRYAELAFGNDHEMREKFIGKTIERATAEYAEKTIERSAEREDWEQER